MSEIKPIQWDTDQKVLTLLDQRRLPCEEVYLQYTDPVEVAEAIRSLVVRGAPAIGCTAAYGMALAGFQFPGDDPNVLRARLEDAAGILAATRPTAVNLFWAMERMRRVLPRHDDAQILREDLEAEAEAIFREDLAACRHLGDIGAVLVPNVASILTHCNAGALATAGYGTALGVIRSAHRLGKVSMVWVDETRPVLQGARLTAWEMVREGIPTTLITDNMAGWIMSCGRVDFVVVGADRIAANGDVANKIGTYGVAVLARRHGIPFVVAAPTSTVDLGLTSGEAIPIEERDPAEVTGYGSEKWAPDGVSVYNPAFDVTPSDLVSAIVTERGVARAPYGPSLKSLMVGA